MSIPASRILRHIRLQINDFDEAKVSDFQILNFLNRALSAISTILSARDLDFLSASQTYSGSSASAGANLPADFQAVKEVTDGNSYTLTPCYLTKTPTTYEYKVMGEKIYCGAASYTLFYRKFIAPIDDFTNDNVALPAYFLGMIVQVTILLMQGAETGALMQTINNMMDTDIPMTTYNKKRERVMGNAG